MGKYMKHSNFLLVSFFFIIGGCSSSNSTIAPPITSKISVIGFTKELISNSQASGDKVLNKLISGASAIGRMTGKSKIIDDGNGELIKHRDYSKYSAKWIISTRSKFPSLKKTYAGLCDKKGGYFRNDACLSYKKDEVLFYAKTQNNSHDMYAYVTIIEPNHSSSPAYLAALKSTGYRSELDVAVESVRQKKKQKAKIAEQQRKYKQELERQNFERPLIRKIGSKICKVRGSINYIGYVERIAGDRVQIRISHAHFVNSYSSSPGSFKEHIIWDNPNNWHICK